MNNSKKTQANLQILQTKLMLPFSNLIRPDKESHFPVYKQITNRLINLIKEGMIPPGAFLPGTRQMAELLSINRKTAINAYEELLMQEWNGLNR